MAKATDYLYGAGFSFRYALTARCCSFIQPASLTRNICKGVFSIRWPVPKKKKPDPPPADPGQLTCWQRLP